LRLSWPQNSGGEGHGHGKRKSRSTTVCAATRKTQFSNGSKPPGVFPSVAIFAGQLKRNQLYFVYFANTTSLDFVFSKNKEQRNISAF
jgi:hypothetical protein